MNALKMLAVARLMWLEQAAKVEALLKQLATMDRSDMNMLHEEIGVLRGRAEVMAALKKTVEADVDQMAAHYQGRA